MDKRQRRSCWLGRPPGEGDLAPVAGTERRGNLHHRLRPARNDPARRTRQIMRCIFDTGLADDRVVTLPWNQNRYGNLLFNMLNSWALPGR